jgi:uncharacterized protein YecT (DUF1311 family)
MKVAQGVMAALLLLAFTPVAALAQGDRCPTGYSNDQCDQWRLERADKALSDAIENMITERSKLTTRSDRAEAIKQTAMDAHRAWLVFRDAECKAYVAASVVSARTDRAKNASCLLRLTEQRTAEVKKPIY